MIVVVVLVLVVVCIVTAIIYANHNMKMQWQEANNTDVRLVREAVEHSQHASNMTNPVLALMEVTQAKRTIEILCRRYGVTRADEISGQNTGEILDTITRQQDRILGDLCDHHPDMIPRGELKSYTAFGGDRDESRDAGVAHIYDAER